jgi:AcrR family transcriptional regulator
MARPRSYDDDLRARLLDAAAALLAAEGPHALTTRRIAAEVGTSTTAIYTLIGSKDEIVRAMYLEGFNRLAEHLARVERTADPLADLEALGREYHAMAVESPHLYNVMFTCPIPEFDATEADLEQSLATLVVLIDAVQRCVDEGALVGDATSLALQLWAMNHGVTSLGIAGMLGPPAAVEQHLADASRALIRGFSAPVPH